MDPFINYLTDLFRQQWQDDTIQLKVSEVRPGSHRVGGYIIWNGFDAMPQRERQSRVWQVLRNHLNAEEQQRVSAILTLTPLEEQAILENE